MQVVILAGGFGTRISEESQARPKPMIEIGQMPILWHIMKIYFAQGFDDFIICCGYKQHMIKKFFSDYYMYRCDVTYSFINGHKTEIRSDSVEPWRVTLVDTGLNTMTGGRIKRIQEYITEDTFMLTYGDGVSNVDLRKLLAYHYSHQKLGTLTAIRVGQRFGVLGVGENDEVQSFREKSDFDESMINGGFMVMNTKIFDYIEGDTTVFEKDPLERIASEGQLMAYRHDGYWKCMDTQRDMEELQKQWESEKAPWKIW